LLLPSSQYTVAVRSIFTNSFQTWNSSAFTAGTHCEAAMISSEAGASFRCHYCQRKDCRVSFRKTSN
jgi:hypothetical protein